MSDNTALSGVMRSLALMNSGYYLKVSLILNETVTRRDIATCVEKSNLRAQELSQNHMVTCPIT